MFDLQLAPQLRGGPYAYSSCNNRPQLDRVFLSPKDVFICVFIFSICVVAWGVGDLDAVSPSPELRCTVPRCSMPGPPRSGALTAALQKVREL